MCKCCCEGGNEAADDAAAGDGVALMHQQHTLALCSAGISQQASYISLICHLNYVFMLVCACIPIVIHAILISSDGKNRFESICQTKSIRINSTSESNRYFSIRLL